MNSWHDRRILDSVRHRPPHPPGADGRRQHAGDGDRRQRSRRPRRARLRAAQRRAGAQGPGDHPPGHQGPDQRQLLLPHAAGAGAGAHRRLAQAAGAVLSRARPRSRRADPGHQPGAVRRGVLRLDGRGQAGGRELPFRIAGAGAARPRAGDRRQDHLVRHHRRRGALARGARRRRDRRPGSRGRRPSRQLPLRRHRPADGHLRAGAAGGRCGEGPGDRRRRHRRRARHRGGVRARRSRRCRSARPIC